MKTAAQPGLYGYLLSFSSHIYIWTMLFRNPRSLSLKRTCIQMRIYAILLLVVRTWFDVRWKAETLHNIKKFFSSKISTSLDLNHHVFTRCVRKIEAGKRWESTEKVWNLHLSSNRSKKCRYWGRKSKIFYFTKSTSIKLSNDVFTMF